MGLRAGNGAAGAASSSRAEVWKFRDARSAGDGLARARAPEESIREAIVTRSGELLWWWLSERNRDEVAGVAVGIASSG